MRLLTVVIMMTISLLLLAGCGSSPEQYLKDNGQLINTKTNQFNPEDVAIIYEIPKSPSITAKEMAQIAEPDFMSEPSKERVLLAYPEQIINITANPADAEKSMVELASKEFVANNYNKDYFDTGDFMTGYLAAEIVDEIFDFWKYSNKTGSVRKGGTVRGGGPTFGK